MKCFLCGGPHHAKGMCKVHYSRWFREVDSKHKMLERRHRMLDEMVSEWIQETRRLPSSSTVMELMEWSYAKLQS